MWFHDHDLELNLNKKNVLYLYRDPVDVIYSDCMSHLKAIDNKYAISRASLYARHVKKYVVDNYASHIVKYENFQKNFNDEFKIIIDFFNGDYDEERLNVAVAE